VSERASSSDPLNFVHQILAAASSRHPHDVGEQLDLAVLALGVGGCLDEVLFPAMREIGRAWQSGLVSIEEERLASEAARGWLERSALGAPEPSDAPPMVLTCGPADLHSIGLEALGLLLRHHRRRCRVLGPRTSVRALTTAVRASRPSGVVVVSHLRANRLSATQSLRAAAALGAEVFYAGHAFSSARLRRNVPGTHLDTNLQDACALLLRSGRRPPETWPDPSEPG